MPHKIKLAINNNDDIAKLNNSSFKTATHLTISDIDLNEKNVRAIANYIRNSQTLADFFIRIYPPNDSGYTNTLPVTHHHPNAPQILAEAIAKSKSLTDFEFDNYINTDEVFASYFTPLFFALLNRNILTRLHIDRHKTSTFKDKSNSKTILTSLNELSSSPPKNMNNLHFIFHDEITFAWDELDIILNLYSKINLQCYRLTLLMPENYDVPIVKIDKFMTLLDLFKHQSPDQKITLQFGHDDYSDDSDDDETMFIAFFKALVEKGFNDKKSWICFHITHLAGVFPADRTLQWLNTTSVEITHIRLSDCSETLIFSDDFFVLLNTLINNNPQLQSFSIGGDSDIYEPGSGFILNPAFHPQITIPLFAAQLNKCNHLTALGFTSEYWNRNMGIFSELTQRVKKISFCPDMGDVPIVTLLPILSKNPVIEEIDLTEDLHLAELNPMNMITAETLLHIARFISNNKTLTSCVLPLPQIMTTEWRQHQQTIEEKCEENKTLKAMATLEQLNQVLPTLPLVLHEIIVGYAISTPRGFPKNIKQENVQTFFRTATIASLKQKNNPQQQSLAFIR